MWARQDSNPEKLIALLVFDTTHHVRTILNSIFKKLRFNSKIETQIPSPFRR